MGNRSCWISERRQQVDPGPWEVLTLVVVTVGVLLLFLKVSRATGLFLEYIFI